MVKLDFFEYFFLYHFCSFKIVQTLTVTAADQKSVIRIIYSHIHSFVMILYGVDKQCYNADSGARLENMSHFGRQLTNN